MSIKVKDYLQKAKKIYQEKSEEVEKKYGELKKLNDEYQTTLSSRDYTPEGRQKKIQAIDVKRDALKRELASLRESAKSEVLKVRDEEEKMFYNYYNASPDDVDLKMMELIRSGILTDAELIHYGEKANQTMKRLIGKELEKRMSPDAQRAGRVLQMSSGNPHLQAIDSIMEIGDYAVGGARMGGYDTVKSILERFDSLIDPVIAAVKDVKTYFDACGNQHFSVEGSSTYKDLN